MILKVVAQSSGVCSARPRGAVTAYTPSALSTSPASQLGVTTRRNSDHDIMGGVAGSGSTLGSDDMHRKAVHTVALSRRYGHGKLRIDRTSPFLE